MITEKPDPYDFEIQLLLREFNDQGISIMDYPPATRRRALELEEQMTQAANQDDRGRFIELLHKWKHCLI